MSQGNQQLQHNGEYTDHDAFYDSNQYTDMGHVNLDHGNFDAFNMEVPGTPLQDFRDAMPANAVGLTTSAKVNNQEIRRKVKGKKMKEMDFSGINVGQVRGQVNHSRGQKAMNRTFISPKMANKNLLNNRKQDLVWQPAEMSNQNLRNRPFDQIQNNNHSQSVTMEHNTKLPAPRHKNQQQFASTFKHMQSSTQDNSHIMASATVSGITPGLPHDDSLFTSTPNNIHDTSINSIKGSGQQRQQLPAISNQHAEFEPQQPMTQQQALKGQQIRPSRGNEANRTGGMPQQMTPNNQQTPVQINRAHLQTRGEIQQNLSIDSSDPRAMAKYVDRFATLNTQGQSRKTPTKFNHQMGGPTTPPHLPYSGIETALSQPSGRHYQPKEVPFEEAIEHKVVTQKQFDKMAREKAQEGGIIEKTIFILKPVYVPIPRKEKKDYPKNLKYKLRNKKQKHQHSIQKQIYREQLQNVHGQQHATIPHTSHNYGKGQYRRSSLSQHSNGSQPLTGSMKNILVSGDPSNPDYALMMKEESMQKHQRQGQMPLDGDDSVLAYGTDHQSEDNKDLLEQLQGLMVNSHLVDKIFQKKQIAQLFPHGKLPEICNHGKGIQKEEIVSKLQVVMTKNNDQSFYDQAKRDLQYYGRQNDALPSTAGKRRKSPRFSTISKGGMRNTMHGGTPSNGRLTPIQNRLNTGEKSHKGSNWGSKMKQRRNTNQDNNSSLGRGSDIGGTHERQAALNLILNKSNQFSANQSVNRGSLDGSEGYSPREDCSIIHGESIANKAGKKNPYTYWREREIDLTVNSQKHVPKNFYTNYRTNMVRDAHEIVNDVIAGRMRQSGQQSDGGMECIKCEENKLMECECVTKAAKERQEVSLEEKIYKIKHRKKRRTFYELSRPYQPCRRGCSVHHSPFWHAERMRAEHLARANAGETKVMLLRQIETRPKSVDSAKVKAEIKLDEIDFVDSKVYQAVVEKQQIAISKKLGIMSPKNRGAGASPSEDYADQPDKLKQDSIESPRSATTQKKASKMDIYSQTEINYLVSVLKRPEVYKNENKFEHLKEIYTKCKRTLKFEMGTIMLSKQYEFIIQQYKKDCKDQTSHDDSIEVRTENLIKLLLRNSKMQEAKDEITRILRLIEQRCDKEEKLMSMLNTPLPHADTVAQYYSDLVGLSARIYRGIDQLKVTEKTLNRPFMFRKKRYDDGLHYDMRDIRTMCMERIPAIKDQPALKQVLLANGEIGDMRDLNKPVKKAGEELLEQLDAANADKKPRDITIRK